MAEPEIVYCDDYEAVTGKTKPVIETKVIEAPAEVEVAPATVAEVE
jgi:hypothetical protein